MAKEQKKRKRPTAEKRNLQNKKRRLENRTHRSTMRTAVRRFEETLNKSEPTAIKEKLNNVYSVLDKSVKRGIVKQNTANRTKARLAAKAVSAAQ